VPTRAMHPCHAPGCPSVTPYRYCEQHEHRAISETMMIDIARPQSQKRGYDNRWKSYASRFLKNNPVCVDPSQRHVGRVVPASQVDHIIPHKMDMKIFWDTDNHQALCASCGGYKSATEKGGRAHSERAPLAEVSGSASFSWTDEDFHPETQHKDARSVSGGRGRYR
jgi:5-methylcytosine-specific restriction protein A